ncbi:MAG: ABC transporter substrate-binding protein [Verrucomicrobiales bacterium]|nr:ABC transporter substrate-binding protein [Verrucomicrobiales bacterium]
MISRTLLPLFAAFLTGQIFFSTAQAQKFPGEGWEEKPDVLVSEWAEPGGKFIEYASQFPKSFNYTIENNIFSRELFRLMFETLLGTDPITYEDTPSLARSWEISEDKLTYTFHLSPKAKWSDGKKLTSEDVVWSFHAMKNPEHRTGSTQAIMARLIECKALDEHTVQIKANEVHWKNLIAASSFRILPKHWWEKQDFNNVHFEFPVVSGPYRLGEVNQPHFARLEKRDDYWNGESPEMEGLLNFDTIEFRFYSNRDNAFEAFKKGDVDFFSVYTSNRWVKETVGERFEKNWIAKQNIHNRQPIGFQGFAMNMRREPYDDKRVRKALAHLLDRKRMNNDIMHNQYDLTRSYWPDLYNKDHECKNPQIDFDPARAKELFNEAGWKQNPDTGKLEKDGKPFVIKFLTRDPSTNKFLLIYEEALNDVGIELEIDQKDWSGWAKDMDVFNYEMTWAPWGAIPLKDAEPMWHSKTKDLKQGNNITGFADERVDKLIDQSRELFDVQKRNELIREIDAILVEETPYVLLWHIGHTRLLYWNKFGYPDHVLGSFQEEWAAKYYWWIDPDQEADLEDARANGTPLPKPPERVYFDEVFTFPEKVEPVQ